MFDGIVEWNGEIT